MFGCGNNSISGLHHGKTTYDNLDNNNNDKKDLV